MSAKKTGLLIAGLAVLVLLGGFMIYGSKEMEGTGTSTLSAAEESMVRALVTEFGNRLKNVPLAAEPSMLSDIMRSEYGGFVTPELLAHWYENPANAPGRLTSSLWPEHMEITSVEKSGGRYIVHGNVILVTSEEITHDGTAGREEAVLALEERNGAWLISDYEKK